MKFYYVYYYLYYSRKQYSPLSPNSPEESDSSLERINIDLMHELRDVIFPNTPPVDRTVSLPHKFSHNTYAFGSCDLHKEDNIIIENDKGISA